jgi:hypothetical protein
MRFFQSSLFLGALLAVTAHAQPDSSAHVTLQRTYKPGETLTYEMTGSNHGWEYHIDANDVVRQDDAGSFYEEIGWSNLRSNAPITLSPASLAFRQTLSLTADKYLTVPDLSKVQPQLIGPITDLLTFYADLHLAAQKLDHVGQHVRFPHGAPNSWADGQRVVLGQDAVDFDLTLLELDTPKHAATLLVRHVPPEHPQITLPAEWMKTPVADTPNNWVQVEKAGDQYIAQVGKEIFEVKLKVDTRDGKILSADLHNPVTAILRHCQDAALTRCDSPAPETILRQVSIQILQTRPVSSQ